MSHLSHQLAISGFQDWLSFVAAVNSTDIMIADSLHIVKSPNWSSTLERSNVSTTQIYQLTVINPYPKTGHDFLIG